MKLNFRSSGKCILFGEHAVVYGRRALAASIAAYTEVTLERLSAGDSSLIFNFPTFSTSATISSTSLREFLLDISSDLHHLVERARTCVKSLPQTPSGPTSECLVVLLCLCGRLLTLEAYKSLGQLQLSAASTLPIGAGLGSSASFAVALAAALLCALEFPPLPPSASSHSFIPAASVLSRAQLDRINALAFEAECVFHGTPSGIDNTVATFGGLVLFRRDPNTRAVSIEHHTLSDAAAARLRLLLVNTGVPRSTKVLVERVRSVVDRHAAVASHIFDAIDGLVGEACALLCANSASASSTARSCTAAESAIATGDPPLDSVAELVHMNQQLLAALNVSHPAVDRIVGVCGSHGVSAKLTGAGGGGVVLAFLSTPAESSPSSATSKPDVSAGANGTNSAALEQVEASAQPADWQALRAELESQGFIVIGPLTLGGAGLQLRIEI